MMMEMDTIYESLKKRPFFSKLVKKILDTRLEVITLAYSYEYPNDYAEAFVKIDGVTFYAVLRFNSEKVWLTLARGRHAITIEKSVEEVIGAPTGTDRPRSS